MQAHVGIDISKDKLNFALVIDEKCIQKFVIDNNQSKLKKMINRLKTMTLDRELVFACKSSGYYHKPIVLLIYNLGYKIKVYNFAGISHEQLQDKKLSYSEIIARKIDSSDDQYWTPEQEEDEQIRDLLLYIDESKEILKEEKDTIHQYKDSKVCYQSAKRTIKFRQNQIKALEKEVAKIIDELILFSE